MANEILKQFFQEMHSQLATSVDPDSIMDALLSKDVLVSDDYDRLRHVPVITDRCRDLLSLLHQSSHPQAFIRLRLALLNENPQLVDEVDKRLTSPTSQLHQLRLSGSSNDEERIILPGSSKKNELHEALENESFEEASKLIASYREADLVECFECPDGSYKSCLHIITGMSNKEQATKLCGELMKRTENALNREQLLNTRTADEFEMGGRKVRARVAAIHIAAYNGNSGLVRLLCQECGVYVNCNTSETLEEDPMKGMTPLEWAAREGHTELVKVLLDNKANVNVSRQTDGVTPLHVAAHNGDTEVVKLLLDNKADVNASDTDGVTPLHHAVLNGHTEVVKLLLDNKADVNARHEVGATPLYMAAQNGHAEVVKLLLGNKADVNASDTDGATPLYMAAQNGHAEVVKLMLDNKADVNACKTDGATPLHVAALDGHTEVVKLLLDNKADVNASIHTYGATPLYVAAMNGHTEVVKLLLDNKADVNATRHTDGVTPLYIAAQNGYTQVVKLLLDNKAEVNASNNEDVTPLYIAAQEGHSEVARLLLANKADVNASCDDGEKPIDAARRNRHVEIVKLLEQNNVQAHSWFHISACCCFKRT